MPGVIELVDKIDQKSRNYTKIKDGNKAKLGDDLLMEVEVIDPKSPKDSQAVAQEDYVDMEAGEEIFFDPSMPSRKRFVRLVVILLLVLVSLVVGVARRTSTSHKSTSVSIPQPPNDDTDDFVEGTHSGTVTTTTASPKPLSSHDTPSPTPSPSSTTPAPTFWSTKSPLHKFHICAPHLRVPEGKNIYAMANLTIVPEDKDDLWEYTFSDMDISDKAEIIAIGMSDYARDTEWSVGLVRVYAYNCILHKYKQLGQDLMGSNDGEQFGYRVSSSDDGKIMAISATQIDYDDDGSGDSNSNGYVQAYYLDEDSQTWTPLGSIIHNLDTTEEYYALGNAIDLSNKGDRLAVLAMVDTQKFVCRVFEYVHEDWSQLGGDLVIDGSDYMEGYDYDAQIDLSDDGSRLSVADPQIGVMTYDYEFETDTWKVGVVKNTEHDVEDTYISSVDMDNRGRVISFASMWALSGTKYVNDVKVVDFERNGTVIFNKTYAETSVGLTVAVSDDGNVAAIVASRDEFDDNLGSWNYEEIGALTVVVNDGTDNWYQLQQEMGVPGAYVHLSGNGEVAVIGSDDRIMIYGVSFNRTAGVTPPQQIAPDESQNTDTEAQEEVSESCIPFAKASSSGFVGSLTHLPVPPNTDEQHDLAIALSKDGSFVAIGMDTFDGEDRGMVRTYAYNCSTQSYSQIGLDLYGIAAFDGFGKSVGLTETPDGILNMVVGANQPPPDKTGYVVVFQFDEERNIWFQKGKQVKNVKSGVEDIGHEVRISNDASTIAIVGSIIDDNYGDTGSFVRVLEYSAKNKTWKPKGPDIEGTVDYTDYGSLVKISLDGSGDTLAITGSYNRFGAMLYKWDSTKKNWTESTLNIPVTGEDDFVEEFAEYDGFDVALAEDGEFLALSGNWYGDDAIVRIFGLDEDKSWTVNALTDDYYFGSSVALSAEGNVMAIGDSGDAGALYVIVYGEDEKWTEVGKATGNSDKDSLGARVAISQDGRIAAATSRAGYVSFFLTSLSDE